MSAAQLGQETPALSGSEGREPALELLSLRAFYFFSYSALGALFPFLTLILASWGLRPTEIAWVMVVIPASNFLVPPLWGALADALGARLPLLRLACLGSGLAALLFLREPGLLGAILSCAAFSLFRSPITSLADAATYDRLGGARANFSAVRIWGSVGFGAFATIVGLLWSGASPGRAIVPLASALYMTSALATLGLRSSRNRRRPRALSDLVVVLSQRQVVLFLLGSAVYYMGHAMYDSCFSLHLQRLGCGAAFIGVAWTTGVLAEIALMAAAPRFIHRLDSGLLLSLCAAGALVRWLLLSQVTTTWAIALVQLLHGVTFGLWYLSLVKFTQERAPDHLRTSLQTSTTSATGAGMVVGYLAGGPILERLGGSALFGSAALSALAALALYVLAMASRRPAAEAAVDLDGSLRR